MSVPQGQNDARRAYIVTDTTDVTAKKVYVADPAVVGPNARRLYDIGATYDPTAIKVRIMTATEPGAVPVYGVDASGAATAFGGIPVANLLAEYRLDEGAGQRVYNRANGAPVASVNLLPAPEFFELFTTNNGGRTYGQTDPDGGDFALRYLSVGGTYLQFPITLAATTYTYSFWAKSNTGVDQVMRVSLDNFSTTSTYTATSTWQRFTKTQAVAAGATTLYLVRSDLSANNLDLLLYGLQLEVGGSATAYVPPTRNLTLGANALADAADPTWANGGLHFTGTQQSQGLGATVTLSEMTVYALVRWSDAAVTHDALIVGHTSAFQWGLYARETARAWPVAYFSAAGRVVEAKAFDLNDNQWHVVAFTADTGGTLSIAVDGYYAARVTYAAASIGLRLLELGGRFGGANTFPGDIAYVPIYGVAHTQAQILATTRAIAAAIAPRGIVPHTVSQMVVVEGDSISSIGTPAGSYATVAAQTMGASRPHIWQVAVPGSKVGPSNGNNAVDRAASVDATYDAARSRNVLSMFSGTNDLTGDGDSAATLFAEIKAYCQARKAVGWRVIICTLLPSNATGNGGDHETRRLAYNAMVRAEVSPPWDYIADFGDTATTMGAKATAANTTYYSDGLHPTATGHGVLAPLWQAAVAAALA